MADSVKKRRLRVNTETEAGKRVVERQRLKSKLAAASTDEEKERLQQIIDFTGTTSFRAPRPAVRTPSTRAMKRRRAKRKKS